MKTLHCIILAAVTMVCGNLFAQKSQQELYQLMQERNEYYFTFNLKGDDNLKAIAHSISVDRVDGTLVTAYANNKEFANFNKFGYEVTLQTPPSMLEEVAMWDGSDRTNYDWNAYPTYEAYEEMMYQFGADHPDRCEIINLGTLPSGRKILIAHLHNGTDFGKPKFLYTSTIHGDETTGWIIMLRLIDYLLENPNDPEVQNVMNHIDLFIGPLTNPDGTYYRGNNNVSGARRNNINDVDLNRNYADPHGGPHPDDYEYQLETQWFMQFAQYHPFVMAANYHGGSEVLNYPWDNTYTLHADDAWWQFVCHEYADLCHGHDTNYMNMVHPNAHNGIINGAEWYMIGGGRQDYMNGYAQCREVTIECSNTKLVSASQLPTFWDYNKEALFAYMGQCLNGIHGTITDSESGQPLEAKVTIVGHDDPYSFVTSHMPAGDYHRPIKGGTYDVTYKCSGYYPQTLTITVVDGEAVVQNVQLEPGEGIIPDFESDITTVTLGGNVSFSDNTWGLNLVSWQWAFEGGTPATSTERNPSVTYHEAGTYDVSLTVTNALGESETITKEDYIRASDAYNMHNGTITTCNAMFYDDGGPFANYSNRKNYTMTFKPEMPEHTIKVIFEEFYLENDYDFLYVYDGTSTSAPQIGTYTGTDNPGTLTATNAQGALTFQFKSDEGLNMSGWVATVSCVEQDDLDDNIMEPVKTYPNPAKECFTIEASGDFSYQLYNSLGQSVLSGWGCDKKQIDIQHLSPGIYLLHLEGNLFHRVEKLVIEK